MSKQFTNKQLKKELKRNNLTILEYINTFLDDSVSPINKLRIINNIDENSIFWNNINSVILKFVEKERKNLKV